MNQVQSHRGPDAEGVWVDAPAGIALGHRRLSILDLSPAGAQPMQSPSGRYVIAYNGEIYNFRALQKELGSGFVWRGHSDTEVVLAAIETWGLERTLAKSRGMFAFALWDRKLQTLTLGRDRFGVKPLFYSPTPKGIAFASELKGVLAFLDETPEMEPESISQYLQLGYVPAPNTIYKSVFKIEPAQIATIASADRTAELEKHYYWSAAAVARNSRAQLLTVPESEMIELVDQKITEAVQLRMISDVPLGAFLSGGIDSSLVTAAMKKLTNAPVKTFSIGVGSANTDEAPHARAIAKHLQTDHCELYVTADDAARLVPSLPAMFDEPFGDSSQIPTHLVSKLARTQVTVALSGDGGDEFFGGYNRYFLATRVWGMLGWVPYPLRSLLGTGLEWMPMGLANFLVAGVESRRARKQLMPNSGYRVHKLGQWLRTVRNDNMFYEQLVSHWSLEVSRKNKVEETLWALKGWGLEDKMMLADTLTYLPEDILVKVDRASMRVGLECREPLLDYTLFELAWRLPPTVRIRNQTGKWILRKVLERYMPAALFERPKTGFGVPVGEWLRGTLRPWAEDLIASMSSDGVLNRATVQQRWSEHLTGKKNWEQSLWVLLMFQAWKDTNKNVNRIAA